MWCVLSCQQYKKAYLSQLISSAWCCLEEHQINFSGKLCKCVRACMPGWRVLRSLNSALELILHKVVCCWQWRTKYWFMKHFNPHIDTWLEEKNAWLNAWLGKLGRRWTCMISSTTPSSKFLGTKPAPIPWILWGPAFPQ